MAAIDDKTCAELKAKFEAAFKKNNARNIKIRSRSGKEYWINEDQLAALGYGGLLYGEPVNPHPRAKRKIFWMAPENVEIV